MWKTLPVLALPWATMATDAGPEVIDDRTCTEEFESFISKFHKEYDTAEEKEKRQQIFCENLQWIRQRNSEGHNYTVGLTPFADLSRTEFRSRYGMKVTTNNISAPWGGLPQAEDDPLDSTSQKLLRGILGAPSTVDWRSKGAVSVVQQQGKCGACWSFAANGAVEGAWKIYGGGLYTLSEQQLLDCAGAEYGNDGCHGGNPMNAFVYARDKGLCTARSYTYQAAQGSCHANQCSRVIPVGGVRGYLPVRADDENAMMQAVAQQPVAVAIDGNDIVFQLYTGGIISKDCGTKLDHGVLLVGYGNSGGQAYWIIKNSWGLQWGEDGFGRLARGVGGEGECGILSQASYPVLDKGKVVPGTFDPAPGTVAALFLAVMACCCITVVLYMQFCRRTAPRGRALLSFQTPAPAAPAPTAASRAVVNPWARQAVTPASSAPTAPAAAQAATAPPAQGGRTGNSAPSRLLQQ